MAGNFNIPGVFITETDQSFYTQGTVQLGASVIGPTQKGLAFVPTVVTSYTDFIKTFGEDPKSYTNDTVKNYLSNSDRCLIVKVASSTPVSLTGLSINYGIFNDQASNTASAFIATASVSGALSPNMFTSSADLYMCGGAYSLTKGSSYTLATLLPTTTTTTPSHWTTDKVTSSLSDIVDMRFKLQSGSTTYTACFNPAKSDYITQVFGTSPVTTTKPFYVYANNETLSGFMLDVYSDNLTNSNALSFYSAARMAYSGSTSGSVGPITTFTTATYPTFEHSGYQMPQTPWIQSQTIGDSHINLFRVSMLNHGVSDVFIGIEILNMPGTLSDTDFGKFRVKVLQMNKGYHPDRVLESFDVTLDPAHSDFILKSIGDESIEYTTDIDGYPKVKVNGTYTRKSRYITVELNSTDTIPESAMPYGFGTYISPVEGNIYNVNPLFIKSRYSTPSNTETIIKDSIYYGFNPTYYSNYSLILPKKPNSTKVLSGSDFNLEDCTVPVANVNTAWATAEAAGAIPNKYRKFLVAFEGGTDGLSPIQQKYISTSIASTNVFGYDCSSTVSAGTVAYRKAIDIISDASEYDINMLLIPGILNEVHPSVTTYAIDMCENRGDVFFVMDSTKADTTVSEAVDAVAGIDTNYAATYYPWVKVNSSISGQNMVTLVPPSVVLGGVIAFNDKVAAEWWAPAGINRGGIDAVDVNNRISARETEVLLDAKINPIKRIVNTGIAVWGQKTLQARFSKLGNVNVRRLLINLKKFINTNALPLLFEPNNVGTRTTFINTVSPYMENIQNTRGLTAFKIIMDETTTSNADIDRGILRGKILIQPMGFVEAIFIDFTVTASGVEFSEV